MWLVVGFASLGFLVGSLVGLTSESVVSSTISLLFSLVGGSLILLLNKLSPEDRRTSGQLLFSLAVSTILGVVTGILTAEFHVLSPGFRATAAADNKYLRSAGGSEFGVIDTKYNMHAITAEEAYRELRDVVLEGKQ